MFIGFDYGTANCSVAVMRDNDAHLLALENNDPYLPSMLCAPTREAVSEWLSRHGQVPAGSDENIALLRRSINLTARKISRLMPTACILACRLFLLIWKTRRKSISCAHRNPSSVRTA